MIFTLIALILFQVLIFETTFDTNQSSKGPNSLQNGIIPSQQNNFLSNLTTKQSLQPLPKKTPFSGFVENQGQLAQSSIKMYFSGSSSFIGFSASKIYFVQKNKNNKSSFFVQFDNSNNVEPTGVNKLHYNSNFFVGNSRTLGVNNYNEVWYYNIYPKIDLKYYITNGGLKYEFIVRPGGKVSNIKMSISHSAHLQVSPTAISVKSLVTSSIILSESNLHVFQGSKSISNSKFIQLGQNTYSFAITNYNKNSPLIIDPLWLQFSTQLGGSGADSSNAIKIDGLGNIFLVGSTSSVDFNTSSISSSVYSNTYSGGLHDIFVMKLNPTGTKILFSTYIGGNGDDVPSSFALDGFDNVYIVGKTNSTNFPMQGPFKGTLSGGYDGFITVLKSTGDSLNFSTYFGGSGTDSIERIVLDSSSNMYITGQSNSYNFPTQPFTNGTGSNLAFVSKFSPSFGLLFSDLIVSTPGAGYGIALDSSNNIYISGSAVLSSTDAFLMEFLSNGTGPIFKTFLAGNGTDTSSDLAINSNNDIIVTGYTSSSNFPLVNPIISSNPKNTDGFVSIFNSTHSLIESTYLGGNSTDYVSNLALDSSNNIYLTGLTISPDFPMVNAFDTSLKYIDAFVMKLNPDSSSILFSTYLGGNQTDEGMGIASYNNNIYVTGYSNSIDFPQVNSLQSSSGNSQDAFLTIYGLDNTTMLFVNKPANEQIVYGTTGNSLSWTATDDNPNLYYIYQNNVEINSNTWSSNNPITISIDNLPAGSYNYTIVITDKAGITLSNSVTVTVSNPVSNPPSSINSIPTINFPGNKQAKEFFGSVHIFWYGTGNNPTTYTIYQNGQIAKKGFWQTANPIFYNESWNYKPTGTYNITIDIFNANGNSATDTVFITITTNPAINQSVSILTPIVGALLVINFVAIGYEVVRKKGNYDPESPPNVPAGITIASNDEYMFISWIGCDTHPIIQWLQDKKLAVLLIFLMRLFRIDSKHHIFIAIASQDKKDFPNSDSWIYKKKINHTKSKFRPNIAVFDEKLYIAYTAKKDIIKIKTLDLQHNNWSLSDETIPNIDPKLLKSRSEPTLTREYDPAHSKYVRLYLSFYSSSTKSITLLYLENGIWHLSSKRVYIEKFGGSLSSSIPPSEQADGVSYTWVTNKQITTKSISESENSFGSLRSAIGGTQLTYIADKGNFIKQGTFLVYDKSVRIDKFNVDQQNWEEIDRLKKKTKYSPAITQFKDDIYVVWINKTTPFYFKEFFLATIVNNLTNHDIIEYEPLDFEKITPKDDDLVSVYKSEFELQNVEQSEVNTELKDVSTNDTDETTTETTDKTTNTPNSADTNDYSP